MPRGRGPCGRRKESWRLTGLVLMTRVVCLRLLVPLFRFVVLKFHRRRGMPPRKRAERRWGRVTAAQGWA